MNKPSNIRILWLDISASYSHSSLALPSIHAQGIPQHDRVWHKVYGTLKTPTDYFISEILDFQADIIAYTAWLFTHKLLMEVLERLKKLLPNVCILGGGPEYMGDNEKFLREHPFIDAVFRGEGEEVFYQFLDVQKNRSHWSDLSGICFLNKDSYFDGGMAKINNFDQLQLPESSPFFVWDKHFIQIETSRGCMNTCSFCVSGKDQPVRTIPPEKLTKRIETAIANSVKKFRILDRTFNGNNQRAHQLLDIFSSFAGKAEFHLEIHPALLSKSLKSHLQKLPKGLLHVEAGVQSLNPQVTAACGRPHAVEKVLEGIEFLCSLNLFEVHADLIAGLPHYSLEQIYQDVKTLMNLSCAEIQLESLKCLPGTLLRENASQLKILFSAFPPYEVLQSDEMTYEDLQESRHLSRMLDMYYNHSPWQEILVQANKMKPTFLKSFTLFLKDKQATELLSNAETKALLLNEFFEREKIDFKKEISIIWIQSGLSLRRGLCENVKLQKKLPENLKFLEGNYVEGSRIYSLDLGKQILWFGFFRAENQSGAIFFAEEKFNISSIIEK